MSSKTSCITKDQIRKSIYKLVPKNVLAQAGLINTDLERATRVDIFNISADDVFNMLSEQNADILENSGKVGSDVILSKLKNALDNAFNADHRTAVQKHVDNLFKTSKEAGRAQAMGLQLILDTIVGEINKIDNMGVSRSDVTNAAGIPYIPAHRLAATLGRQIYYTKQARVFKGDGDSIRKSAHIEHLYYVTGMSALKALEQAGYITIHPRDTGIHTVKDYQNKASGVFQDDKKKTTGSVPAIELNADKLGAKSLSRNSNDNVLVQIRGTVEEGIPIPQRKSELGAIQSMLDAVAYVSVPVRISLPAKEPGGGSNGKTLDSYTTTGTTAEVRTQLEDTPVYFDEAINSFFNVLHNDKKRGANSASQFIKDILASHPTLAEKMFGFKDRVYIESDKASHKGRNLSKTVPIDDVVEYFKHISGETSEPMYMMYFAGRNTRIYVDNSVVNPNTSKFMRHALVGDIYTMDTNSAEFQFFVDKVAMKLANSYRGDITAQEVKNVLLGKSENEQFSKDLNAVLDQHKRFKTPEVDTTQKKISVASAIYQTFDGLDLAETLSVLQATTDLKAGLKSGKVTSRYMVSSDASGSGGLLTMMQALGSNPEVIKTLLQQLGVFKQGKQDLNSVEVKDIYGILQNELSYFLGRKKRPVDDFPILGREEAPSEQLKTTLTLVMDELFEGNIRDLSKGPTMTFIYDQSETGAIHSLSKEFTERFIEKYSKGNKAKKEKLISLLSELGMDVNNVDKLLKTRNFKLDLKHSFGESGLPKFLYDQLEESIKQKYLKEYKEQAKQVFEVVKSVGVEKMKMFPAPLVLDMINGSKSDITYTVKNLNKYGVPLTKIEEVASLIGSDTVLTREEFLKDTIMNVSGIHSVDTGALVHGLKGLIEKHKTGVIVVHDDIRSSPALVMEAERQYNQAVLDMMLNFDLHEQVLKAAAVYAEANGNKNFTNTNKYRTLMNQIKAAKASKQALAEDTKDGYDVKTSSVIGDKALDTISDTESQQSAVQESVSDTESVTEQVQSKPAVETKPEPDTVAVEGSAITRLELLTRLDTARKSSPIIDAFMKTKNGSKLLVGKESKFALDNDTITIKEDLSDADFITQLEHEITHSYTASVIQEHITGRKKDIHIDYVVKAFNKLSSYDWEKHLSNAARERMEYIAGQSSLKEQIAEFLAVMESEPKVAKEIYSMIEQNEGKKSSLLKRAVELVMNKIREVLATVTPKDLESADLSPELLYTSIISISATGKSLRENQYELVKELNKEFPIGFGATNLFFERKKDGVFSTVGYWGDAINASMSKYIVERALQKGDSITGNLHNKLKRFESYRRVVDRMNRIYQDSTVLQQLMHKITNGGVNKLKKNEILSLFTEIANDKEVVTSKELERFKNAMKGVSEADKESFFDFTYKMSLADYFILYPNGVDIQAEIARLENGNLSDTERAKIRKLVDFNVNDNFKQNTPYNLHEIGFSHGENAIEAKKYLALKSIEAIGEQKFNSLMENTALMDVTRDNLLANAALLTNNPNIDVTDLRDKGIVDEYDEPVIFKAIDAKEMVYFDNHPEWKVLREPSSNAKGVVYKKVIDSNYQAGAFTTIQYNNSDQDKVFDNKKERVVLTLKEKKQAGLITNPAQSIVRTMAQNLAIQDSNVIREKLLQGESHFDITKSSEEFLVSMINDKDVETPWFVNDVEGKDFNKLHKTIRDKYVRVPANISRVDGFNKKVKYVRKDLAYWLVGDNSKSWAAGNPTVQKAIRITKDLVSATKIGMVILNPAKIFMDNVFNIVYMAALGVDIPHIAKYYSSISKEYNEYRQIKNEIVSLKIQMYAEKTQQGQNTKQRQMDQLISRLEQHPINGVVKRGFINSLSSSIVMQNDNPGASLKKDIDKVLKKVLQDDAGKNNAVGRFLMRIANSKGLHAEEILESFSVIFSRHGATQNIEAEIKAMAQRVEHIKNDDDVIAYVHQYLNSPDSEFVKLGTHMTDLTDVIAKEGYFRHLTQTMGMDPKEAEIEVLKAFPDYKEGLPTAVQQLDSAGILMFPQYWLRMMQAMYRLAEKRPASFGSEMLIAEMLGNKSQLWSQTIMAKATSNWGLVHNPVNHIGYGSIVPTNIF